jgi:hypothetical protein
MTTQNEFQQRLGMKSLATRTLQGAGIALAGMTTFLSLILTLGDALGEKSFFDAVWQFLPLVTGTVGGALGGVGYHVIVDVWYPNGWKRVVGTIVSIFVYGVLVWMSMIIGLAATGQWD